MRRCLAGFIIALLWYPHLGYTLDSDGDGLTDQQEDVNNNGVVDAGETDPQNADTDHGGEADGNEIAAGRNPLQTEDDNTYDRDGDGLTNGEELALGTNLDMVDTDGDGLNDAEDDFPLLAGYRRDNDQDGVPNEWEAENRLNPNNPNDGLSDADNDGLSNRQEFQAGSNPHQADSDGDGLNDEAEAALGTDPNNADTDGDGVTDGEEQRLGINPHNADTDGDGVADNQDPFPRHAAYSSDSDSDGIPDQVESQHGLDPSNPLDASDDADGDGLTNLQEFNRNTDPTNADTDGDGISDGDEASFNTDPTQSDSDNDGISDGDEVARGLDPSNPDSDRDGLRDNVDPFPTDRRYTKDSDGDGLPDSWETANGLDPGNPADASSDADGDGLTMTEEFARGTDPQDPDSDDDSVIDGEDRFPTNPAYQKDSDDDGLPDAWEQLHGLDPNNANDNAADADNDGLSNSKEFALGTNPNEADSDNDGIADAAELNQGTNPAQADTDSDGVDDGTDPFPNNHLYTKDSDGDGLPDAWERQYGLDPLQADDASRDDDQDGLTNLEEFQQLTDPFNPDTDRDGIPDGEEVEAGQPAHQHACLQFTANQNRFDDSVDHWAYPHIRQLHQIITDDGDTAILNGMIVETDTGTERRFAPQAHITRYELLSLSLKSTCTPLRSEEELARLKFAFSDVSLRTTNLQTEDDAKRRQTIYAAFRYGIVRGYPDGSFRPDQPVTRAEALKILVLAARLPYPQDAAKRAQQFSDVPPSSWFTPFVQQASVLGLIAGYQDGSFRPGAPITRAEAAKLIAVTLLQNEGVNSFIVPLEL